VNPNRPTTPDAAYVSLDRIIELGDAIACGEKVEPVAVAVIEAACRRILERHGRANVRRSAIRTLALIGQIGRQTEPTNDPTK
jgi:hypothetical protein